MWWHARSVYDLRIISENKGYTLVYSSTWYQKKRNTPEYILCSSGTSRLPGTVYPLLERWCPLSPQRTRSSLSPQPTTHGRSCIKCFHRAFQPSSSRRESLIFTPSRAVAPAVFHRGPAPPHCLHSGRLVRNKEIIKKRGKLIGGYRPRAPPFFPSLSFLYAGGRNDMFSSCVSTWVAKGGGNAPPPPSRRSTRCLHSEPAPCCLHSKQHRVDRASICFHRTQYCLRSRPTQIDSSCNVSTCFHDYHAQGL